MSQVPTDAKERRLALDLSRSFCIQAPAGSGKTELLTQRYLSLLAACDRPEEILAITFTRKAAAEMRNRILDSMARANTLAPGALDGLPEHDRITLELAQQVIARDAQQQWQLFDNSTRLRISTIDSFNAFLCGQLPVVSELGIMPDILDDSGFLYEEAVLDLLAEVDSGTPLSADIAGLLAHVNNQWRMLSGLLCGMLGKRDQWLANILDIKAHPENARAILEQTLQQLIVQKLDELAAALSPYLADLLPLLQFAAENLKAQGNTALSKYEIDDSLPPQRAECLGQWQEISHLLLTNEHTVRKQLDKRNGFPAPGNADNKTDKALYKDMKDAMVALLQAMADNDNLVRLFEEFRHLPEPHYPEQQWRVLENLTTVLPALVSHLALVFRKHGQADHTQVSIAALSALGHDEQPTDLALRLDYQLRHILVDEFQDTSTLQISLLEKLTHGWQPDDGRTLFIVGDGMQSCYGFRNANVGLFLAARDHGIGQVSLDSLQLTANFRSQAGIVDWVNRHFAPAFPPQDDIGRGGVSYSPAEPVHPAIAEAGVELLLLTADCELDSARAQLRLREADLIAEKIQALHRQHPDDSIALLVRTRSHLTDIIPALRRCDIAWNAANIDPLNSYPVVADLLMLLRALLNPADVTAWYALLRAPWLGLALADIHRISRYAQQQQVSVWQAMQSREHITALSGDARQILQRTVPILARAREQRRRLPLREWLEKTWLVLGGPATVNDSHYFASINHFFDLLQEYDEGGEISDIQRFEAKVAGQYADGLNPLAPLTIMTIHKAKGLEFDHVIIPGLERQPRPDDNPLLRWREHISTAGDPELVLCMPAQRGQERDPTYQHLKYEAALQQRLESTRLFYIGVTRAIKSACLVGSVLSQESVLKAPDRNALLSALWPQLETEPSALAQLIQVSEQNAERVPETGSDDLVIRRLPPSWLPAEPFPFTPTSPEETNEPVLPGTVHDNLAQRRMGDIIHECLCRTGEGRLDLTDKAAVDALAGQWRQLLAPVTDDTETLIQEIRRQLARCLDDEQFRWLLLEQHQDAACELSLSDYRFGRRRTAIVDRTFVDEDDVRWIIDFKSGNPVSDTAEEAFLDQEVFRYRPQLARYADLFHAMESREVRTALYFTALPRLQLLDIYPANESGNTPDGGG